MKKLLIILIAVSAFAVIYFSQSTDVTANLDTYIYDLPFQQGSEHKVVQGYGGNFSHKYKAALDFNMTEGTPVHAAREGVVYAYQDRHDRGGPLPVYQDEANYLMIKHPDGSIGCYWHLKKNGVVTKKGKVRKGQLIGYSGSTGFVLRPHLHFAVKSVLNYEMNSFVRTKFRTTNGIELLRKGESYKKP